LSNYRSWLTIETSRGCPYKCSFCDWGGGTFTKTVKKDFSTVLDEISWAGEHKFDAISFTDANFGIFSIDKRDIIQHPIERYQKLLEIVNIYFNHEASHYIERSWGVIFFPMTNTEKIQN
jgi:radical SAM superfamily enzyme YgiQ (UPF0313 family)